MSDDAARDGRVPDRETAGGEKPGDGNDKNRGDGNPGQEDAGSEEPGDVSGAGTPPAGENICSRCNGTGRIGNSVCPDCAGSGKVTAIIGGA